MQKYTSGRIRTEARDGRVLISEILDWRASEGG